MREPKWTEEGLRTRLYRAVEAAGAAGASREQLHGASPRHASTVNNTVRELCEYGYLARTAWGTYVPGPQLPPIPSLPAERALALIDDCPPGVGWMVLARELGLSLGGVEALMRPLAAAGQVESITMPARHGGGPGWCMPGMRAAGEEPQPARLQAAQLQHPDVRVPVVTVDIDRIHRVQEGTARDVFDAQLHADHGLTITSGAITLRLPPGHTAALVDYLQRAFASRVSR